MFKALNQWVLTSTLETSMRSSIYFDTFFMAWTLRPGSRRRQEHSFVQLNALTMDPKPRNRYRFIPRKKDKGPICLYIVCLAHYEVVAREGPSRTKINKRIDLNRMGELSLKLKSRIQVQHLACFFLCFLAIFLFPHFWVMNSEQSKRLLKARR